MSAYRAKTHDATRAGSYPALARLFILVSFLVLLAACSSAEPAPTATPTPPRATVTPETVKEEASSAEDLSAEGVATAVSARTPVPSPTPGLVSREVEQLTADTRLADSTFFGLAVEDWIDLTLSLLIVLVGYFVIGVLKRLLKWLVRKVVPEADEEFLALVTKYLGWLLMALLIRYAVLRLPFLGEDLRIGLQDIFLVIILVIGTFFAIALIGYAAKRYEDQLEDSDDQRRLTPVIITIQRLAQGIVLVIALSILLNHMGFSVSVVAAILIFAGLVISFGAQDILSDVLSGYIILIDQPFRIGDAVWVKDIDTLGRVQNIGTRTTHMTTGDNREVIIPNSSIGRSQVINYTYPDPRFRVQTEIGVAYGTDTVQMRTVIEQAVRGVDGVLPDKPVDIFYLQFGGSARLVRVRWWISSYRDEKVMLDKVNTALETKLDAAGIELPFDTYDLNLKTDDIRSVSPEQEDQ